MVTKWHSEKEHQQAFEKIKHEITKINALAHYDPNKDTILSVDASTIGLGATLWQIDKGERKPIAYHSRKLNQSEKRYAVNELEMLAIVNGTEHFKHYLLGRKFTVESDQKALINVLNKQKPNKTYSSRLTRWKERLLIFDLDISYKQGSLMGITDLLSRNSILIRNRRKILPNNSLSAF